MANFSGTPESISCVLVILVWVRIRDKTFCVIEQDTFFLLYSTLIWWCSFCSKFLDFRKSFDHSNDHWISMSDSCIITSKKKNMTFNKLSESGVLGSVFSVEYFWHSMAYVNWNNALQYKQTSCYCLFRHRYEKIFNKNNNILL